MTRRKRYYGEEATLLTPAEMRQHEANLAKLKTMSLEELQALEVPPPPRTGHTAIVAEGDVCATCGESIHTYGQPVGGIGSHRR